MKDNGNKKSRRNTLYKALFLLIQLAFYVSFLYLDIFEENMSRFSNSIKYLSIILCFMFSIFYYRSSDLEKKKIHDIFYNRREINLLRLALFFTVISDFFLLLTEHYSVGIIFFIMVQLLYSVRISSWVTPNKLILSIILRVISAGILGTLVILFYKLRINPRVEAEIILAAFYFMLFVSNTVDSIGIFFRSKKTYQILFACGLLLYFLCDINVALFNMADYMSMEVVTYGYIHRFSAIGMWLFYLPGQVLIALSGETP